MRSELEGLGDMRQLQQVEVNLPMGRAEIFPDSGDTCSSTSAWPYQDIETTGLPDGLPSLAWRDPVEYNPDYPPVPYDIYEETSTSQASSVATEHQVSPSHVSQRRMPGTPYREPRSTISRRQAIFWLSAGAVSVLGGLVHKIEWAKAIDTISDLSQKLMKKFPKKQGESRSQSDAL